MLGALESRGPMSAEMVPLNIEIHKGKEEKQRQAHQNLASHDVRTAKAKESATCHRCRHQRVYRVLCRHQLQRQAKTIKIDFEEPAQKSAQLRMRRTIREPPARMNRKWSDGQIL